MLPKPPQGYLDRSTAETRLNRFVFGKLKDGPVRLPKRAEPAQVDEFLGKALDTDAPTSRQVSQSGRLMRFFDLQARAQNVTRWLKRRERERNDVIRSMTSIAILGDLGDDALQQQAADYYRYLAAHAAAEPFFEQMVDLFFNLPEKADAKWIEEPIESRRKALEPKVASDVDAEVAYKKLGKLTENRLKRILTARQRKYDILHVKDPIRRRYDLARCYLALELFAHVDLQGWAVMMLQRDCNAGQPADLARTFSQMLDLLMSPSSVPGPTGQRLEADEEKSCVTSSARALEFYHGTLTEAQAKFVEAHANPDQDDVLYWEPE